MVIFELVLVFLLRGSDVETMFSKITMGVLFSVFLLGLVREVWSNIKYIDSVLNN